jgi:hypothetical protein
VNLKLLLAALLLTIIHPASAVIGQDTKQEQVLAAEPEQVLAEAELLPSLAGDYPCRLPPSLHFAHLPLLLGTWQLVGEQRVTVEKAG